MHRMSSPPACFPSHVAEIESPYRKAHHPGPPHNRFSCSLSLTCPSQHNIPSTHSSKRCLYFDPDGIRARTLAIPVASGLGAEYAALEILEPFLQGRELIRGCRVGVTRNNRRCFYMIYTKYRRSQVNCAVQEESRNLGSWCGPLVVMRLDTFSGGRLVSITTKDHKETAIKAVAKCVFSVIVSSGSTIDQGRNKVYRNHERENFLPCA
jgi:hypothetical protein